MLPPRDSINISHPGTKRALRRPAKLLEAPGAPPRDLAELADRQSRVMPFVLDAGEPAILLGTDTGPNPAEFVLHALAACLTTSLVYVAAARGVRLTEVQSTLDLDLVPGARVPERPIHVRIIAAACCRSFGLPILGPAGTSNTRMEGTKWHLT
jgi:hypothetical protein